MKKLNSLLIFLSFSICIMAQEAHNYQLSMIKRFPVGSGTGEFKLDWADQGGYGPRCFVFDSSGRVYIANGHKKEMNEYGRNYQIKSIFPIDPLFAYTERFYLLNKKFTLSGNGNMSSMGMDGKIAVTVRSQKKDNARIDSYLSSGYCVIYGEGTLLSIPNPGPDPVENNKRNLNEGQTRALFAEPEKYGLVGLSLDEKNRLFLNRELVTRNYKTFFEYWSSENESETLIKNGDRFNYTPEFFYRKADPLYCGSDNNKNTYWASSNLIMVFGPDGFLKDMFIPENAMEKKKTSYAVHPSGDVYFLDYDKEGVYLYRVENVWDKQGRAFWHTTNATVTAPNVRLRKTPSLTGAEQGLLQTDERVAILETSKEQTTVGAMKAPWYKVKTKSGITAWAFGGFVEKDEE